MAEITMNWLYNSTKGRACKHDAVYTKHNSRTGKNYAVKLCNPNQVTTPNQQKVQSNFALVQAAIRSWISDNKVESGAQYADYVTLNKRFLAQHKESTLFGYIYHRLEIEVSGDKAELSCGDILIGTVEGYQEITKDSDEEKVTLTCTVNDSDMGSVSPATSTVEKGSTVKVTATNEIGYHFYQWSDGSTENPRTVTVNADMTLQAEFKLGEGDGV